MQRSSIGATFPAVVGTSLLLSGSVPTQHKPVTAVLARPARVRGLLPAGRE